MNIAIGLLKSVLYLLTAIALAFLSTLAAIFGGSFIPSRWALPTSGAPRSDLWADEERKERLKGRN